MEEISPNITQQLLDNFNAKKKMLGPEQPQDVSLPYIRADDHVSLVRLGEDTVNHRFEKAFRAPLEVSSAKMVGFAKLGGGGRVMVSGGSCRNLSLKKRVIKHCTEAGLPEPLSIDDFPVDTLRSW